MRWKSTVDYFLRVFFATFFVRFGSGGKGKEGGGWEVADEG